MFDALHFIVETLMIASDGGYDEGCAIYHNLCDSKLCPFPLFENFVVVVSMYGINE